MKFNDHHTRDAITRDALRRIRLSPRLYRTTTEAVAEKPVYATPAQWDAWMSGNFPAWRYNAATRRWHGPLTDLAAMSDKFPHAIKSDGVKAYLANKGESNENP